MIKRNFLKRLKLKSTNSMICRVSIENQVLVELTNLLFLENSVYCDPVRKIQEDYYAELLKLREEMAHSLDVCCEQAQNGGANTSQNVSGDVEKLKKENDGLHYRIEHLKAALIQASDPTEKKKLEEENRKLKYRIEHLKMALDEQNKQ